jgi:sigma-B regulation protein RsbQ
MGPTTPGTVDALVRNNVLVTGNPAGRPIVFAHGFGCSGAVWREVAPRFESDYRVITFDYVGAGDSDVAAYDYGKYDSIDGYASDVIDILDALDLDDVVFVGHSVGAMVGVVAVGMDSSRFGALVLVGPSARYTSTDDYVGGFSRADVDGLIKSLDANYLGWSSVMAPVIMGNAERPELGAALTESFCRVNPAIASQFARVTFLSDNRADLARIALPTLVLQCRDDAIAPFAVGEYVHKHIAGSDFRVLEATGHVPILSSPGELVGEIESWLE